jgi:predicted aldo/keto reductase-like oxidoreductase
MKMEKRKFNKTQEDISLLGFGCMRLPVRNNNSKDIDTIIGREMVDLAIAEGVNYFDTAYMYHEGHSESFIGHALKGYDRKKFNLVTKMPIVYVQKPEDVERFFNEQLERCDVDYFDFYLVHNINRADYDKIASCGVYEQLKEKQKQGKIRNLGFSFHDRPALLSKTVETYDWDFGQIQLNYMDWLTMEAKEQYEILTNKNIPVIIMEPVKGGTLAKLPPDVEAIFKSAEPNASIASWAIRYAASLENVLTVLSGMSDMAQVKDNIKTIKNFKPLTDAERKVIDKALKLYIKSKTVPCTGCRYCMPCPAGVYIPKIFGLYNNYLSSKKNPNDEHAFKEAYRGLGADKQASKCVSCKQCEPKCPQHLAISNELNTINRFVTDKKIV